MRRTKLPEIVGHVEVARLLGIGHQSSWRLLGQGVLPEPDWRLMSGRGRPLWLLDTIEMWAVRVDRELTTRGISAVSAEQAPERPEIVGMAEIAGMAGVRKATVEQWRSPRGILPEPDWPDVAGGPIWLRSTVESWLRNTGRVDVGGDIPAATG